MQNSKSLAMTIAALAVTGGALFVPAAAQAETGAGGHGDFTVTSCSAERTCFEI
ncbi:hypothetical protein [Nonomuraea typhae]|uniref:Uncharacterized protein n=1 Tax=Nonomuraea typhae TaxID=2603600 RepID=A0ABW7YUY0_9ACTN